MSQQTQGIATHYKGWKWREGRANLRVLWWVKRFGLSRREWGACKEAARQVVRYRGFYLRDDDRNPGPEGNVWRGRSPDEVLLANLATRPHPRRQSQLLQVVCEVAEHMGADLSVQYRGEDKAA